MSIINKTWICILFVLIVLSICTSVYAENKILELKEVKAGDTLICQKDIGAYSTIYSAKQKKKVSLTLQKGDYVKIKSRFGKYIKLQSLSNNKIAYIVFENGMLAKSIEKTETKTVTKEETKTVTYKVDNSIPGYKGYYLNLSDKEKIIYSFFYNQVIRLGYTKIDFSGLKNQLGEISNSEIRAVVKALRNDHPDFLYKTNGGLYIRKGTTMYFGNKKTPSLEQINEVVDKIVNKYKNKSDYEKMKGAHDEICELMTYKTGTSNYIDRFISFVS